MFSSANILQIAGLSSCCSCYIFSEWFAYFFPMKQVKHSSILYSPPKTTQPCPKAFSVNHSIIWQFCCMTDAISSHIPKFFYSSWLWWIVHGILANQKQRNILRPPPPPDLTWLALNCIWFIIPFWLALLAFFELLFLFWL